ncbi:MAG: SIS domain-containing protein [Firmicutes bacterium]|nr:SIS domain-containing protein [Bacillota bacterium]
MYLTRKETLLQYEALEQTFDYLVSRRDRLRRVFDEGKARLVFIGCGSGYYLCQSGAVSANLRLPVQGVAMAAGDLMLNGFRYKNLMTDAVLVAPSRSGSTSEVLEAIKYGKANGASAIGIVAKEGSPLEELADECFVLPWAFDEAVCQTKTVTNLYAANLILMAILADDDSLLAEIRQAIKYGPKFMERWEDKTKEIAKADWSRVVVLGDGELEGIAAEAALAFAEICQIPASYHHVLDVRHGPMVLVREDTLVIMASTGQEEALQSQLVADLKGRGAKVVVVGPVGGNWRADWYVSVPAYEHYGVTGIPFIYIPQSVSFFKAMERGINPDLPDGLDAWIKLPSTTT